MLRWVLILWPSFLMASGATIVYFALFDPVDLDIFGVHVPANRIAAYTIGFFAFWLLAAVSSALTLYFERSAADVNRMAPNAERPASYPKREAAQ